MGFVLERIFGGGAREVDEIKGGGGGELIGEFWNGMGRDGLCPFD